MIVGRRMAVVCSYANYAPAVDVGVCPNNPQQHYLVDEWLADGRFQAVTSRFEDKGKQRQDFDRPGLWACLKTCHKGLMVAHSLSRIGDAVMVETTLSLLGRQQSALATVVEGVVSTDLHAPFAKELRDQLVREYRDLKKVRRERKAKAMANGERVMCVAPAGTRFEPWGSEMHTSQGQLAMRIVPCLDELELIQYAQRLAKEINCGPSALAKILNEDGYRVRYKFISAAWMRSALAMDLDAPTYGFIPREILAKQSSLPPEAIPHKKSCSVNGPRKTYQRKLRLDAPLPHEPLAGPGEVSGDEGVLEDAVGPVGVEGGGLLDQLPPGSDEPELKAGGSRDVEGSPVLLDGIEQVLPTPPQDELL